MNAPTEREVSMTADSGMVAMLNKSEIDQQITTAKQYPRSIKHFLDEASAMATLNESIAKQCIYALPRDGKVIEGASARFGEIVASAWGNCRAGARVVNETSEFVVAQGVFHDLERNVAITYEVQRRITGKNGNRYGADMIGVTANAACSIALRNAILKGVPKAFWEPIYKKARAVVAGDLQTLANKRATAIKEFVIFGITEEQILAKLGRAGVADITVEDMVILFGLLTAIQDGDTTPEQAFSDVAETKGKEPAAKALPALNDEEFAKELESWAAIVAKGKKTPEAIIANAQTRNSLTPAQVAAVKALKKGGDKAAENATAGAAPVAVIASLRKKAEDATISESDVCKRLKVETLDGITTEQVEAAIKFINNPAGE